MALLVRHRLRRRTPAGRAVGAARAADHGCRHRDRHQFHRRNRLFVRRSSRAERDRRGRRLLDPARATDAEADDAHRDRRRRRDAAHARSVVGGDHRDAELDQSDRGRGLVDGRRRGWTRRPRRPRWSRHDGRWSRHDGRSGHDGFPGRDRRPGRDWRTRRHHGLARHHRRPRHDQWAGHVWRPGEHGRPGHGRWSGRCERPGRRNGGAGRPQRHERAGARGRAGRPLDRRNRNGHERLGHLRRERPGHARRDRRRRRHLVGHRDHARVARVPPAGGHDLPGRHLRCPGGGAAHRRLGRRIVLPIGGFNGADPVPTLAQFQTLVSHGALRYVLVSGEAGGAGSTRGGGFGATGTGSTGTGSTGTGASGTGSASTAESSTTSAQIRTWVLANCTAVSDSTVTGLYDCGS